MEPSAKIIGHERVREVLARNILGDRMMPAWIFGGPLGVGKFTMARMFAGLIVDPETGPDDVQRFMPRTDTSSGVLYNAGTHPDIHVVRKELAIESPIQTIRDRKQRNIPVAVLRQHVIGGISEGHSFDGPAYIKPHQGHAKVFIIDEAELLTVECQSLLLKTLEEPPPNTWFILVTTSPARLHQTIHSRCQQVSFGPLDEAEMSAWVEHAQLDTSPEVLDWAIRLAAGSPGLVMQTIDQDLHAWHLTLAPMLEELAAGAFPARMGAAMADLVEASAVAAEKADSHVSKEAAGQHAMHLLITILGSDLRARMREELEDPERYANAIEILVETEERVRRNVNRKLALSGLVAALHHALAPAGSPA